MPRKIRGSPSATRGLDSRGRLGAPAATCEPFIHLGGPSPRRYQRRGLRRGDGVRPRACSRGDPFPSGPIRHQTHAGGRSSPEGGRIPQSVRDRAVDWRSFAFPGGAHSGNARCSEAPITKRGSVIRNAPGTALGAGSLCRRLDSAFRVVLFRAAIHRSGRYLVHVRG